MTRVNGIGGCPGRRGPRGYVPAKSAAATRMIRLRYVRFMATSASRPVSPARYRPASSNSGDDAVGSRYSSSAASFTDSSSVRTGVSGVASTEVSMSRNMSARVGRSASSSDHVVGFATMWSPNIDEPPNSANTLVRMSTCWRIAASSADHDAHSGNSPDAMPASSFSFNRTNAVSASSGSAAPARPHKSSRPSSSYQPSSLKSAVDRSTSGNPRAAGVGTVCRDVRGRFLITMSCSPCRARRFVGRFAHRRRGLWSSGQCCSGHCCSGRCSISQCCSGHCCSGRCSISPCCSGRCCSGQ